MGLLPRLFTYGLSNRLDNLRDKAQELHDDAHNHVSSLGESIALLAEQAKTAASVKQAAKRIIEVG